MQIGNAWTDSTIDNYGAIFYWWSHALISDKTYKGILEFVRTSLRYLYCR